jgi:hypothetical protein
MKNDTLGVEPATFRPVAQCATPRARSKLRKHNSVMKWDPQLLSRAVCSIQVNWYSFSLFVCLFVCVWLNSPQWARASSFTRLLDHTQRRTTVGRTPLDEWPLPDNTQHSQQTFMPPVGFGPTISADKRPHIYDLDRAATGTVHFPC